MIKNRNYCPLTATPFQKDGSYIEIAPCKQLEPYVRCFWGMERRARESFAQLVVPDTCVDIIYYIDYTENKISGGFCGVNDHSFYAYEEENEGHVAATFAIRFYAWGAYVFSEDSLKCSLNAFDEVGVRFAWLDRLLRQRLLELKGLGAMISYTERLLAWKVSFAKENEIVNGAVSRILDGKGSVEVADLAREAFVSGRHLERLFHQYVGITPKKLSNLVRYQFLWRDILYDPDLNILDAVHKYGYTDQSHLLREFKRYHSLDVKSAKALAFQTKTQADEKMIVKK